MIHFDNCCDPGIVFADEYGDHFNRAVHNRILSLKFFGIDPNTCIPWISTENFDVVNAIIEENRPPMRNPFNSSIIPFRYMMNYGPMNIWGGQINELTQIPTNSSVEMNLYLNISYLHKGPFWNKKTKLKVPDPCFMRFHIVDEDTVRIRANPLIFEVLNLLPISIDMENEDCTTCSFRELNLIIYMICFMCNNYNDLHMRTYQYNSIINHVMSSSSWKIDPENYLPSLKENIERESIERYNALTDLESLSIVKEQYGHLLSDDYNLNRFMNDTYPGQSFKDVAKLCFVTVPSEAEGESSVGEADSNI